MITRKNRYQIVAERTQNMQGTLVDVGARNRHLENFLKNPGLNYITTDVVAGFDLLWDLERPISAQDNAYEIVCALDVLEHVETLHVAWEELYRIASQKLFISLPNMAHLAYRAKFLSRGSLGDKYALPEEHPGDRHRWVTTYEQCHTMARSFAKKHNCELSAYDIVIGYSPFERIVAALPLAMPLRTYTILFEFSK